MMSESRSDVLEKPLSEPDHDARVIRAHWRILSFVVIFLGVTFGLLAGYREFANSPAMNRYLFVIGQHVSLVLDVVGESRLEGYFRPSQFGGPRAVRDNIAAWKKGAPAPWPPLPEGPSEPPLSKWERYEHRMLQTQRDLDDARQELVALGEADPLDVRSADRGDVGERFDWLHELALNRLPQGIERVQSTPEGMRLLREAGAKVEELENAPPKDPRREELLADAVGLVNRIREEHIDYLASRVGMLAKAEANMGPAVLFVYQAGLGRQLQDVAREISELRQSAALTEEERGRLTELEIRRAELQETRAELSGEDLERGRYGDYAFTFHIVPDCGALQSMIIYIAAVLAFPAAIWKRLAGVAAGVPVLYAVNIFRLSSLGFLGAFVERETFDFFHEVVWQGIYLVFVVAVWLIWMEFLVKPRRIRETAGA